MNYCIAVIILLYNVLSSHIRSLLENERQIAPFKYSDSIRASRLERLFPQSVAARGIDRVEAPLQAVREASVGGGHGHIGSNRLILEGRFERVHK